MFTILIKYVFLKCIINYKIINLYYYFYAIWIFTNGIIFFAACLFYPLGENRRFERVEENIAVGKLTFNITIIITITKYSLKV